MREKHRTRRRIAAGTILTFVAIVYVGNTSHLADPIGPGPVLLAHRGLGQPFSREGLTGSTCTAARMLPAPHDYLENTIASMDAAFSLGADIVELDVQRTTDGRFAVFHDWKLDCRTNGNGVTREHSLDELQGLDIGYGYTADGGRTFPFRGKGVRMMPSLDEVLSTFPDKRFLLDIKSNDPEEGSMLAEQLAGTAAFREGRIWAYGGARPIDELKKRHPDILTITRPRLKQCMTRYLVIGWTGHVPESCRRSIIVLPANVAPWVWGWPNRFLQRMHRVDSRVFLVGDWGGEKHSTGLDDPAMLDELPPGYSGGIWTDRIDLIAPALQ